MPTFRNTLFHLHRQVRVEWLDLVILHLPAYGDGTVCSETSAYKIQAPGILPFLFWPIQPTNCRLKLLLLHLIAFRHIFGKTPCTSDRHVAETFTRDHGATALSGPGPPHCRGFTITLRRVTLGRTPCTSDRPVVETSTWQHTQHSQETEAYASGGIRTRNPSKRAAAEPRLKPRGQRDWLNGLFTKSYQSWIPCRSAL